MVEKYDVIIIGAGPAGLFSGLSINNKKTLILEKNSKAGKKLLISGAGQCNFTNYCSMEEFLNKFGKKGSFLKPALYNFTNKDTAQFFKNIGVDYDVREDNKVFPKSYRAEDILNVLLNKCIQNKAEIRYNTEINNVEYDEDIGLFSIRTSDILYNCRYLIIATGGKSYPQTGSTGEGQIHAQKLGHNIVPLSPALTPIYVKDYIFEDLSGISLKDVSISLWRDNKKINNFIGDLLFTHKNISGPVIINNSRYIEAGDILKFNFTGFDNAEKFKEFFEQKIISSGKLNLKTIIKELNIPKRFIDTILKLLNIDQNILCSELNKKNRKELISSLSDYPLTVTNLGDFNIAMVTKGGVSTKEINSKTMESKIIKNLYFIGEVIDIDGDTGGFNIQAAFSMGKLAGENINKKC